MATKAVNAGRSIIGRAPEDLSISDRQENAGKWVALELYEPPVLKEHAGHTDIDLRLRRIRAFGNSAVECIAQLRQQGADPAQFEFIQLKPPF